MSWKEHREALRVADSTALLGALKDANRFVRVAAVRKLATRLPEETIADALVERLESDRSWLVREEVMRLGARLGKGAIQPLARLIRSREIWHGHTLLIGEALAKLLEAHPDPSVGDVAGRLRRHSRSWLLVTRAQREWLRFLADRIDTALAPVRQLPRPAASTPSENLPLPTDQPTTAAKDLPIPWWKRLF